MQKKKYFRIGEYCAGGIIKAEKLISGYVRISAIDSLTNCVISSQLFKYNDRNNMEYYLNDITTHYHAEKVLSFINQ